MRIGIDARLTYYSQAGISRYIQRLVRELPGLEPAADWVVIHSRKDARTLAGGRRVNAWTPSHHRLERWALGVELVRHRLDLLHSADFIPPQFGAARSVITVHDLNFIHYPQFLTQDALRYYAGQIGWAVGRADHILADSEQTRQDLLELLNVRPDKVTTVHLAADERFRPLDGPLPALRQHGLAPNYVLFVGTLEPRKNIPTLLAAYRRLLDRQATRAPLVLVGQWGWLASEIPDTIAALDLSSQVRVLDRVTGADELVELYNGAALFVLPSFYEGFGLPALEAMACGTPVVVSDRGSLPEVVQDAGLVVDPEDADAWADAMARVLGDDALRTDLVERGMRRAEGFSWQETARQTLRVYRRVLNEKSP